MTNLTKKVAAVFAASGAIGGVVAESFARHGAKMYLSAKKLDAAKALATKINENGGWAEAYQVDAMKEAEIEDFIQQIISENNQLLKDVYDFSVKEICQILDRSLGVVKHLLYDARNTMKNIFDHRCALINKNGICHQCSELNGLYNSKQNQQEALMKIELVKNSQKKSQKTI